MTEMHRPDGGSKETFGVAVGVASVGGNDMVLVHMQAGRDSSASSVGLSPDLARSLASQLRAAADAIEPAPPAPVASEPPKADGHNDLRSRIQELRAFARSMRLDPVDLLPSDDQLAAMLRDAPPLDGPVRPELLDAIDTILGDILGGDAPSACELALVMAMVRELTRPWWATSPTGKPSARLLAGLGIADPRTSRGPST